MATPSHGRRDSNPDGRVWVGRDLGIREALVPRQADARLEHQRSDQGDGSAHDVRAQPIGHLRAPRAPVYALHLISEDDTRNFSWIRERDLEWIPLGLSCDGQTRARPTFAL